MKNLYAIILLAFGLLPRNGWGQHQLFYCNMTFPPSSGVINLGNQPFFFGSGEASGLPFLYRGNGVTAGDTLSNSFIGSGWIDQSLQAAEQNDRSFYFLCGSDPGTLAVAMRTIDCYLYRSATGPTWYQWEYSLDGFATAGKRIGDSIHFTAADTSIPQPQLNCRSYPELQSVGGATFRLYAWGATDTGGIAGFGPNPGGASLVVGGDRTFNRPQVHINCYICSVPPLPPFAATTGTPSPSQQFWVVSEGILDSVTVTAPAGFEVSLDNNNFYPYVPIYSQALGYYYANAVIYTRLKAQASGGSFSGDIVASTNTAVTDQASESVSVTGTVTSPPPPGLTVNYNSLEFGNATAGTTVDKKLILTISNLSSDISLISTGKYLVSTDSIHFNPTATIGHDTANNKTEPVFIRFAPDANNIQFNDSLQISVPADTTLTVRVKGNSLSPLSTVNMTNWNLNWFGTTQTAYGPPDKTQQVANVKAILPSLHADVYALQEVVNEQALANIVAGMPDYAYVIANYGSHANPFDTGHADLSMVPKLAFVYNTTKVTNIQTDVLLSAGINTPEDAATQYYDNWASGRYPYMLTADVNLGDNNGGTLTKKIHFINIDALDNAGGVLTNYYRRKNAAFALDSLVKSNYNSENVVILGNFNDDLNHTTMAGIDTTSFSSFIYDSTLYQFPTKLLSQQKQRSNANYPGVVDNVIVNNTMAAWHLPSSAIVLSAVSGQVAGYDTTTAGHYPVATQFSFVPPIPLPVQLLNFTAIRQDATGKLSWTTSEEINTASFDIQRSGADQSFSSIGTVAAQGNSAITTDYTFIDNNPLKGNNYYRLNQLDIDGKSTYSKTVVLNFGGTLTVHINPNPAHGTANLFVGNASEAFSIQIVDLNGQIVKQIQAIPGTANIPIDVSKLAKGIYSVKVTSASTTTTQKLLVQ
jgi:hypothetical protein